MYCSRDTIKLEVPQNRSDNICMKKVEMKIILECFVEECKIKGRVLSVEEFMEDIENSIGWDEVFSACSSPKNSR